jgi:dephospho-CoA kinase
MRVIGVIGLNGTGKDEVVKYLNQKYGVPLISVGDIVREIAAREKVQPTRENLDQIVKKCFAQYGEGYFLKLVIEKIKKNQWQTAGISGVRSPQDVAFLKNTYNDDFKLICVYVTEPQVRYNRIRQRGSQRDNVSYEDFLREDRVSEELFHIQEAVNMADYSIANDGALHDLHREIERLIKETNILE